jgi:hypothetical protein
MRAFLGFSPRVSASQDFSRDRDVLRERSEGRRLRDLSARDASPPNPGGHAVGGGNQSPAPCARFAALARAALRVIDNSRVN